MPKSSLSVRPIEAIDCALARSSSLFLGVEKPFVGMTTIYYPGVYSGTCK